MKKIAMHQIMNRIIRKLLINNKRKSLHNSSEKRCSQSWENVRNEAVILDEKTHCRKTGPRRKGVCERPAKPYR
jgi:hypothetical protein